MQRFSDCRICGVRLSTVDATTHELNCLQKSQENVGIEAGSGNKEDDQGVKNEDRAEKPVMSATRSLSFEHEDDDDDDDEDDDDYDYEYFSENMPSSPSRNPGNWNEQRNTIGSNPRKTMRGHPGCHDHNSKYSGRRASMPYDRTKPKNLFPPTKKFRYYPVTCEYCWKRFQPNKLKEHQRKHHFGETDDGPRSKRTQSSAIRKGYTEEQKKSGPSKSVGAIPRRLQICYICGRMYGSKSLKIHEPKCLDKWRIQNDQLPPHRRAAEPVKPEPIRVSSQSGQPLPDFDPVAEAAFLSHLNSLIPCIHCSRTFSPDRIMKHESCCIERPKTSAIRQCITPSDGTIGR